MSEQPIEGLMKTTMESIRQMVDVNTIVGEAVNTPDGTVIIPISKVAFGFAAGGGEAFEEEDTSRGFGGGSGAGVSVKPVGFLVCSPEHGIRFMCVEENSLYDRILDLFPQAIETIQKVVNKECDKQDNNDENKNNFDA
ncbi:GerW family sporulation protein [Anaerosinus massiliensis]|uniref:GerW family sporulation protein n=1 Tax=Massilibacillus massiliensis TaxID=1806837 RepID=UPI000AA8E2A5|nr:GerW family sporulation protein [Massilibacillus massiliensis]